jgi:hypothetical protein
VFLNSDLGLAGNEVLFLADGVVPGFSSTTTGGMFQARPGAGGLSSVHIPGILEGNSRISGGLPSGAQSCHSSHATMRTSLCLRSSQL